MIAQKRQFTRTLEHRLNESDLRIQVLIGPRQVGKSTALQQLMGPGDQYLSADSPSPLPHTVLTEMWEKSVVKSDGKTSLLIIDEAQKVPGWDQVIKNLWDTHQKRPRLILSGSSALLVEKGLTESLSGRFELVRAEHWNFSEAHEIFGQSWQSFVEFGCYPGSQMYLKDLDRWGHYIRDSIVEPALGRDLLMLHPVEQPALLRRLFAVAASLPAQIVSLQKLQGQLQGKGSLPTIQTYLSLLEKAFLVTGLEKYSTTALRLRKSSPKLIVHDNALVRAFERPILAETTGTRMGRYFENTIGARFIESGWDVFYWNERNDEVDLVVHGPNNEKYAIEVKLGQVQRGELKGLDVFCKLHPEFTPCLVSGTNQDDLLGIKTLNRDKVLGLSRTYSGTLF